MRKEIPRILTCRDLQEILQISKGSALKLIRSGEIRVFKINGHYRISRDAFLEFITYSEYKYDQDVGE